MTLPDIELVSAAVHDSWMAGKRKAGITSRKAENGEELMAPYGKLSDPQKEQDRATVRTVYAAIRKLSQGESSMLPPKKKPGLDVMIAVGKKPKPDLSDPDSIDEKPIPKTPMAAHEAEESPEEESSEEYGAKLISDIEAAGERHGIDPETSKSFASDVCRAMADCLSGGEEAGETAPDDESQEYGQ